MTNYAQAKIISNQIADVSFIVIETKLLFKKIIECTKLAHKEYKTRLYREGKADLLGILQDIEIWLYYQMVYAQTRICPEEWKTQNSLLFWDTNKSSNPR